MRFPEGKHAEPLCRKETAIPAHLTRTNPVQGHIADLLFALGKMPLQLVVSPTHAQ
jgi:hypothetical protein